MGTRIGVVGAGSIGLKHVEAAVARGIDVACVADADEKRAAEVASVAGARSVSSVSELCADDSVSGVVISVPNFLHKSLAIEALQAGKDVLVEKPMGLNAGECDELNRIAEENNRVLQVGMVHRYTAVGKEAHKIASSGKLGTVYHAKAALYMRRGIPGLGGWFTTKAKSGGGALIDTGVHLLDLVLHVLGFPQPTQVSGQVYQTFGKRMRDYVYESMWAGPPNFDGVCDVEDAVHCFVRFADGCTLDFNVTWAGNFPDGSLPGSMMGFFGDTAGITFELFGDRICVATEQDQRNVDTQVKLPECDQFQDQLVDFVHAIESRQVRGADGKQGRIVQSLIDAIYQSSESGQSVQPS